jgi:hypothetical protein
MRRDAAARADSRGDGEQEPRRAYRRANCAP